MCYPKNRESCPECGFTNWKELKDFDESPSELICQCLNCQNIHSFLNRCSKLDWRDKVLNSLEIES